LGSGVARETLPLRTPERSKGEEHEDLLRKVSKEKKKGKNRGGRKEGTFFLAMFWGERFVKGVHRKSEEMVGVRR